MPRPRISDAEADARRKDRRDPHQCEGPVEGWCFHCRHTAAYRDGLKRKPELEGTMNQNLTLNEMLSEVVNEHGWKAVLHGLRLLAQACESAEEDPFCKWKDNVAVKVLTLACATWDKTVRE